MRIYMDNDEFEGAIEAHLRYRIDEQLREYLQRQLKGVIEAHIARLRITNPESAALNDVVEAVIGKRIAAHLEEVLPQRVDELLKKRFVTLSEKL